MTKTEIKTATKALVHYVRTREADSALYGATILPAGKSAAYHESIMQAAMDLPFKTMEALNVEFPEPNYHAGIS